MNNLKGRDEEDLPYRKPNFINIERSRLPSGIQVSELTRKYGLGHSTIYNWRAKYDGMELNFFQYISFKLTRTNTCPVLPYLLTLETSD